MSRDESIDTASALLPLDEGAAVNSTSCQTHRSLMFFERGDAERLASAQKAVTSWFWCECHGKETRVACIHSLSPGRTRAHRVHCAHIQLIASIS